MTKRATKAQTATEPVDNIDYIEDEIFEEDVTLRIRVSPSVVGEDLYKELDAAKQVLFTRAKKARKNDVDLFPVPGILTAMISGDDDKLLAVWREFDIYATWHNNKWMIRADKVR